MATNKITRFLSLTIWGAIGLAHSALAEDGIKNPINVNNLGDLIAQVVKAALGLTAVLAVAYIVYGGFLYITAAGDESQIKAGKQAVIGAVIGIVVIGVAYALVAFVLGAIGGGGSGGASTIP